VTRTVPDAATEIPFGAAICTAISALADG